MNRPAHDLRRSLATGITDELRQSILRGEFPPGAKLHVADLRKRFAVSLSPLREALSRLGSEGLLEIEDLRGYRVVPVSADNLMEVVCLRTELESLALRKAIALSDTVWVGGLKTALDTLERCSRADGSEAWELQHRQFHMALLEGCKMATLLGFLNTLHDLSDRYRRLFFQTHPPDRDVPDEHRRIFEAASSGETDVACALLRQHIQRTGQNIHAALMDRADGDR